MCDFQELHQPLIQANINCNSRHYFVYTVENTILGILHTYVKSSKLRLSFVNNYLWENCFLNQEKCLSWRENTKDLVKRQIVYNQPRSQHRFVLILYVLAEVHRLVLTSRSCMVRELYYKHPVLIGNQRRVNAAVRDVCSLLHTTPNSIGIHSSGKGLVAGALRIFMVNGDVVDCNTQDGGVLLPSIMTTIHHLETQATAVLVVEKDTVFAQLACSTAGLDCGKIILVTGKGYPDLSTRFLICYLNTECRIPIYMLVDADPHGIEIMLVYRHGSRATAQSAEKLACPQLQWIGLYPSEVEPMQVPTAPLSQHEKKKLSLMLNREYIDGTVRQELQILLQIARKSELEGLTALVGCTLPAYIKTKMKLVL